MLDWDELEIEAQQRNRESLDKLIADVYGYVGQWLKNSNRFNKDLLQKIMLEVYKDLPRFDRTKSKYNRFLKIVVNSTIKEEMQRLKRQKELINYEAMSMDEVNRSGLCFYDKVSDDTIENVLDTLAARETFKKLEKKLTKLEYDTMLLQLQGYSMEESCRVLGRHYKCIDNARRRVKLKARKVFELKVGA